MRPDIDYQQLNAILFVCLGNICRSPTAEAVFRAKAQELDLTLEFDSAGTSAHHIGEAPDSRSMQAAKRRGIDFGDIRSRQVVLEDFERFDLILAADKQNYADLKRLAGEEYQHKLALILDWGSLPYQEVPDPYYGGAKGFELVLDLLDDAAEGLLTEISKVN